MRIRRELASFLKGVSGRKPAEEVMKPARKLVGALFALMMILTLFPAPAMAAEENVVSPGQEGEDISAVAAVVSASSIQNDAKWVKLSFDIGSNGSATYAVSHDTLTVPLNTAYPAKDSFVYVTEGDTITVTVTFTPDEHYQLNSASVKADAAADLTRDSENPNVYTFKLQKSDVTVHAEFDRIKYKVTFSTGKDSVFKTQEIIDGENGNKAACPDPAPTKTGYAFLGWYADEGCTKEFDFDKAITSDLTVYAKWELATYTISYNLNEGTVSQENPKKYTYESGEITLKNPSRAGYRFLGWTGSNGATPQLTVTINKSTGDKSYVANWAKEYPVTVAPGIAHGTVQVYLNDASQKGDAVYAIKGDTVYVTFTPETGYRLGTPVSTPKVEFKGTGNSRTFAMPDGDVSVGAEFELIPEKEEVPQLEGTVSIEGTARVGETLTAKISGANTTSGSELSYQWKANNKDILGATGKTYTLTSDEFGKRITVTVTSSDRRGSRTSAETAAVVSSSDAPAPDTPDPTTTLTGTVEITGTPKVGETLTASLKDSNSTGTLSYQWKANGADIAKATGNTYKLTDAEKGKTITCVVTSTNPSGTKESKPTEAVAAAGSSGSSDTPGSSDTTKPAEQNGNLLLTRTQMNLLVGDYGYLIATVSSNTVSPTWTSSNTRVVFVDSSGNYRAVGTGTATIRAAFGNKTASCYVIVDEQNRYSTNYVPNANGQTTATQPATQPSATQSTSTPAIQPTTQILDNGDGTKQTVATLADGSSSIVRTDASGRVISASMTYSDSAVWSALRTGGVLTLPTTVHAAGSENNASEIQVVVPQKVQNVRVKIPVANMTPGTVAVIESMFGAGEVVKTATSLGDGLLLDLNGSATIKVFDNTKQFSDVTGSEWFAGAVAWASSRAVMNGVSEHVFDPRATMNRAMMTQLLYNFVGADSERVTGAYADVGENNWYGRSVTWASENGIAYPSDYGTFGALNDLTREDMASMLYNYARKAGYNTYTSGNTAAFADDAEISDWARPAVAWAVGTGLLNGTGDNRLSPQGTATRAQVAAIMQRFCETIAR